MIAGRLHRRSSFYSEIRNRRLGFVAGNHDPLLYPSRKGWLRVRAALQILILVMAIRIKRKNRFWLAQITKKALTGKPARASVRPLEVGSQRGRTLLPLLYELTKFLFGPASYTGREQDTGRHLPLFDPWPEGRSTDTKKLSTLFCRKITKRIHLRTNFHFSLPLHAAYS